MLHIISQSPIDHAILQRFAAGDKVLFIENAVLCIIEQSPLTEELSHKCANIMFYALAADLEVRGIAEHKLLSGIQVIEYSSFVDLCVENTAIQSWC